MEELKEQSFKLLTTFKDVMLLGLQEDVQGKQKFKRIYELDLNSGIVSFHCEFPTHMMLQKWMNSASECPLVCLREGFDN